jgi:arsenite/tail-anchored protein-transporting ATPase
VRAALGRALTDAAFTFVVGKGGVGKTTAAGALGLALADAGEPAHLISTDPAHSLADLFERRVGGPARDVCGVPLVVEEFDARAYAADWAATVSPRLLALIEAGTYLDAEDAQRFLDLTFPGLDEVMAALRLGELSDEARRVVVDTAPTGHTLRLLGAGRVLATWTEALAAMAAKAGAVAGAFAGGRVRVAGEELIEELDASVRRFERTVLGGAAAVVVTRTGEVVAAETRRLIGALREQGIRVAAILHTGDDAARSAGLVSDVPLYHAPLLPSPPRGCAALRAWRDALRTVRTPVAGRAGHDEAMPASAAAKRVEPPLRRPSPAVRAAPTVAEWIAAGELQLLLVAGKGGVGKTTCAAALALHLARSRPVLLYGTDPAGSLGEVLDRPIGASVVRVGERLGVRQIAAAAALAELRADYERDVEQAFAGLGIGGGAVLDRRVAETLWHLAPPGIDEIATLVGLLDALAGGETVVLDAAPTGHFLRLIEMPGLALDWTHALMRVILKYGATGAFAGLAERMLALARRLKALRAALRDPARTGAFVVTLAEPLVVAETGRLLGELDDARIGVSALIVNRADRAIAERAISEDATAIVLAAPAAVPPPVGEERLAAFLDEWQWVRAAN